MFKSMNNAVYLSISEPNVRKWYQYDFWTRDKFLSLGVMCLLLAMTVTERLTFKLIVDRMIPYRTLLIVFINLSAFFIYNSVIMIKKVMETKNSKHTEFPQMKLITIAILDSIQFCGLLLSASGVKPILTLLLLHLNTPLIIIYSKYIFPERKYSNNQLIGSLLILIAIICNLTWEIYYDLQSSNENLLYKVFSCFMYALFVSIQAYSTIYKELCIIQFTQPLDAIYLSSSLFNYQFLFCLLICPFVYVSEGLFTDIRGNHKYPLSHIFWNMIDGMKCLLGTDEMDNKSSFLNDNIYNNNECINVSWLVPLYVLSTILLLLSTDYLLLQPTLITSTVGSGSNSNLTTSNTSGGMDRVLSRVFQGSILLACVLLGWYDSSIHFTTVGRLYGTGFTLGDLLSIIVLLIGMHVYDLNSEPDNEVVTTFSPPN